MSRIFSTTVNGTFTGLSANYGDAIERAYHEQLRLGSIPPIQDFPEALIGSEFEGSKHDLMVRQVEGGTTTTIIERHELKVSPDQPSMLYVADHRRTAQPTSAVQQALYDVAEGHCATDIRSRLETNLRQMTPKSEASFGEMEAFLNRCREGARYLGNEFSETILPFALFDLKRETAQIIDQLPDFALSAFDRGVEHIEAYNNSRTLGP